MTKKVKILDASGVVGTYETNATQWGQLKGELVEQGVNLGNQKILLGSTKAELSVPEAELPTEDFRLYLVASKVKSGAKTASQLFFEIGESFIELSKLVSDDLDVQNEELSIEDREAMEEIRAMSAKNSDIFEEEDEDDDDDYDY